MDVPALWQRRRWLPATVAVLLVGLISAGDFVTGLEVNFSVFYFLPIALIAWYGGPRTAILTAVACAVVWYCVDLASAHVYSVPAIGLWNAGLRLTSFLIIALLVSKVCADHHRQADLNAQIRQNLAELEQSTEKIRRLQDELQEICAWTHRIRSEGKWVRFEDFLSQLQIRVSHGMSVEAFQEMKQPTEKDGSTPSAG